MLVVIGLYFLCFLFLWWAYFGYSIYLGLVCFLRPRRPTGELEDYPSITVLVPCYNEEELIEAKIENLASLTYPKEKLKIVFLDGLSTDDTVPRIERAIRDLPHMRVTQTHRQGKILQINHGLTQVQSDLIVNTDVDARLNADVLIEFAKEFGGDSQVGVVGALVTPQNCSREESQYWKTQNQSRLLESRSHSSSIVIANCYAFRNGLVASFPEDVVADDIYLPLQAAVRGFKAIYSDRALAFDTRATTSMSSMVSHKFRKANAYITELLRFMYHLPRLGTLPRRIFLTRVLQVLGLPWLSLAFLLLTISLLSLGQYEVVLWCLGLFFVSLVVTHLIIGSVKLPVSSPGGLLLTIKVFLITIFVLLLAGLTYPFYKQTSVYQKVASPDA